MAPFDALGQGKEKPFVHYFVDGTWSVITGRFPFPLTSFVFRKPLTGSHMR
ncbi:unnamed protein product [Miscanthus lutarioriparius]|uniref:Uncharacterized protein n=1 Tax=Miscanthus lutarioriparius TaxID=422564 RepID=A0A811NKG4_9POAL|nr:unnamed protein product [Miscanthus lutarioriparius]